MTVPPLPNETILLIFEHLWRQLSVREGSETLDAPDGKVVSFVYVPLTLVSKTWRRLALPFLARHLDTPHAPAVVTSLVQQGLAHSIRSINLVPLGPVDAPLETERQYREMLEALAGASGVSLEKLTIGPGVPDLRRRARAEPVDWRCLPLGFFARLVDPLLLSRFTGVRMLTINIPLTLRHVVELANSFPHLQELNIQKSSMHSFLPPNHPSSTPRLSARLDKLSFGTCHSLDSFYSVHFPVFIAPLSNSLSTLHIGISPHDIPVRLAQLFSGTSFPRLRTLLILDDCDPDCAQASAFTSFPALERASVPLNNFLHPDDFPTLPPSLTHLTIRIDLVRGLRPLTGALAALPQTNLQRLEVDYLYVNPHWAVQPFGDNELEARELSRLQSECQRLGIELLGPIVGEFSYDETYDPDHDSEEQEQGQANIRTSAGEGAEAEGRSEAEMETASDEESETSSNKDPRDDYESDEEPFNYDAEDLPAFFSKWSLEKQLEVCAASGVGLSVSAASTLP
ncbi:hypothetical protein JCM5296_000975 [Sporobolomyces johnsonii]